MPGIASHDICCGCGGCAQICPGKCIEMTPDREGFLYPEIDREKCTDCGMCSSVCPVIQKETEQRTELPEVYAAYCNDEDIRSASSSGGIFTLLAEAVIEQGGAVCGARLSDDCKQVYHCIAYSLPELSPLRGSKYVQSRTGSVYGEIKRLLDTGRTVLFSGTPCQAEGLLGYLKKSYENLLTVDIICHGVPSPEVWRQYAEYVSDSLSDVHFRDKSKGWSNMTIAYTYRNGSRRTESWSENRYCTSFLSDLFLRPCCYSCKFRRPHHKSDITIGDFWGIEEEVPELFDDRGISAVMINTEKGRELFEKISGRLISEQVEFDKMARHNAVIKQPEKPAEREKFFHGLHRLDIETNMRRNKVKGSFAFRTKQLVKKVIGRKNVRRIKKLLGKQE